MNKRRQNRIFIGMISCTLLIGAVIFIASLISIIITVKQTGHYEMTQGKVVSSAAAKQTELTNGRIYYTPVIEYEVEGKAYQIKSELQSEMRTRTGIPVDIRYNPHNPQEAIFASKLFNTDYFLLYFGFGLFIMSFFILSMEIETGFFIRLRVTLLCLAFGTTGGGAYLHMGNSIGSFNPFTMIRASLWSIVPCVFLVFAGVVMYSRMTRKAGFY